MSDVKISALPVGVVTSSTPFPAVVAGVTNQVTLAPVYTSLSGKAALSHTHSQFSGEGVRTPLDQSAWAWVNQAGASVTQGTFNVLFTVPDNGESMTARVTVAPATPYSVTMRFLPAFMTGENQCFMGFAWRESGTDKILTFGLSVNAGQVAARIRKMTNPTTFSAETLNPSISTVGYMYVRASDNGTNTKFEFSFDSENYTTLLDQARGTFFTAGPDQIGIGGWNNGAGIAQSMSVQHWAVA